MKTKLLITITISIVAFFTANSFMNLYHYGEYLKMDEGHLWHCSSDGHKQFCDNTSIRIMELFGSTPDIKYHPDNLEEIEGYAIDFDGDVQHLPFADICTDKMKIILLKHSNLALPEEEFVMEDVGLPFGMNQEDFEKCANETSFTKSRWNMITMENSEPEVEDVSSVPSVQEFLKMDCEKLNHIYPEFPSEEVADVWITRMHECLNEKENEN